MIDKLLGRDTIEENIEEPVEKPVETPVVKKESGKSGPSLSIKGLWSGSAGDVNPKPSIEIGPGNDKIFYMIESSGKGFGEQRHITTVLINNELIVYENGTIKEGDPTDTGVIPVAGKYRVPGNEFKVQINLTDWDNNELFKSPEFTVIVT